MYIHADVDAEIGPSPLRHRHRITIDNTEMKAAVEVLLRSGSNVGSMKPLMRRRKNNSRCKPLPPSKRLRLEAQRVLKERVQDIADKKGIKLRFCTLKECESHIHTLDSPCANIRMEIGWPPGVPFVHPHDLPNKAKIGFLEAYEPGWTATHAMELSLIEPGQSSQPC
ncbi:hypothetical protein RJ640_005008 [Escallonia rubra]|uniref:Uncharacterized protein n=1 Tax=Escallonia rubra TaxID=112253 RepID=A0AA88QL85_9ASTE|nr:hypothetical protein RJ640_005008 [Escallonia rubra]